MYHAKLLFSGKQEDPKRLALRKLSSSTAGIAALSSDHVALLAAVKEGEAIQHKLFMWDTKLCVLLHQQNVGEPIVPSKYQCVAHVCLSDGAVLTFQLDRTLDQLIVSMLTPTGEAKTEILLFPYQCPAQSSLLDSLNKMAATVPFLAANEGGKFLAPPSALPLAVSVSLRFERL